MREVLEFDQVEPHYGLTLFHGAGLERCRMKNWVHALKVVTIVRTDACIKVEHDKIPMAVAAQKSKRCHLKE